MRRPDYSNAELEAWAQRLAAAAAQWKDVFIYFKHEGEGKGPLFAAKLASLLQPAAATAEQR